MHKNTKAFTLVEISVVMMIVGIVFGGVVAGQSMIRNYQIVSMTKKVESYKIAVRTFEDKYDALPGDLTNAFDYWGLECGANAAACNGNGNRLIDSGEELKSWFMLAKAKMIDGAYSGALSGGNLVATVNIPEGGFYHSGWRLVFGIFGGIYESNDIDFKGNMLSIGVKGASSDYYSGVLEPLELYNLDLKFDDGVAVRGSIMGSGSGCYNLVGLEQGQYTYNNLSAACSPIFYLKPQHRS